MITKKEIEQYEKKGYDLSFIQRVSPQGNMSYPTRHIQGGDGYYACLHIYKLPKRLSIFWMLQLVNNLNTIVSLSIGTEDKEKAITSINRSMSEFNDRVDNERTYSSRNDAVSEFQNLEQLALNITQGGELVKGVHIRLFVSASNLTDLNDRISEIQQKLQGLDYKSTIYLFEEQDEWLSLFQSYESQIDSSLAKEGLPITATQMGGGYPFNHQSLIDPRGSYIGMTNTDGAFVYDPFAITETRTSFNSFGSGLSGNGKSTLLKLIEESLVGRNTIIRGIEKNGDWRKLITSQGGTILDLSGEDGLLNPLEVFATRTDRTGLHIDEIGSYLQHKTKFIAQLCFLHPSLHSVDKLMFGGILDKFYISKGLLSADYMNNRASIHITGRSPEEYPIMEEFHAFYCEEIKLAHYQASTNEKKRVLEEIQEVLRAMSMDYGSIFNGHTTFKHLDDEQILFFDIDGISNLTSELFQCQLFTSLNMVWAQAMRNGRKMKHLLSTKQIKPEDVIYFIFLLDEAQNIVNTNNLFAVEVIVDFLKEMRKFSAGIHFMTQSLQEVVPEGASDVAVAKINQVFELCNTKIFLRMDDSMIDKLKRIMGAGFSESQYNVLRTLKRRQAMFSFGNGENYTINIDPTTDQLERFDGGH